MDRRADILLESDKTNPAIMRLVDHVVTLSIDRDEMARKISALREELDALSGQMVDNLTARTELLAAIEFLRSRGK